MGRSLPDGVVYGYQTVSAFAGASGGLKKPRKMGLTQKLHELEEEVVGARKDGRAFARQVARVAAAAQGRFMVGRQTVRIKGESVWWAGGGAHASREPGASSLSGKTIDASWAFSMQHVKQEHALLAAREQRLKERERRCWARYALADSVSQGVTQLNCELAAELARVMEGKEAAVRQLAAYEATAVAQARSENRPQNAAGVEEPAGAEDAEGELKKLGDQFARGMLAEDGEETARLFEAGRVVAAGTPHVRECCPTEGTPERELALGGKSGTQKAAQARRCLHMGGGAGESDLVAAAVRLQCAMRGVAARQVAGQALLERRQAESRVRLAAREAEVRAVVVARREARRGSRLAASMRRGVVVDRVGE